MSDTAPLETTPTLAESLRGLPVPTPSPDFDSRVLAALRVPVPWWQWLWQPAQPLLLGASGSCGLTLLLLHLTLSAPQTAPLLPVSVPAVASAPLPSVDALLDRPGLCAGSLAAWNSATLVDAAPDQTPRRPEPRRRAQESRRVTLVC